MCESMARHSVPTTTSIFHFASQCRTIFCCHFTIVTKASADAEFLTGPVKRRNPVAFVDWHSTGWIQCYFILRFEGLFTTRPVTCVQDRKEKSWTFLSIPLPRFNKVCCGIMHVMHNLRNPRCTGCTKCRARQSDRPLKIVISIIFCGTMAPISYSWGASWPIIVPGEWSVQSPWSRWSVMYMEEAYRGSYRTYRADVCTRFCMTM
jgi:hypothetical protein